MTLEKAIIHAEAVAKAKEREAKENRNHGGWAYDDEAKKCSACAAEHRQLAEWLKELKERREIDVSDINVGDMVSRQKAIDELGYCQTYLFDSRDKDKKISLEDAEYAIEQLPSAQPKRKTGRWIEEQRGIKVTLYRCSECGRAVIDDTSYDAAKDFPFCHCGADMRSEAEQEAK